MNQILSQAIHPHTVPRPCHHTKASAWTGWTHSGWPHSCSSLRAPLSIPTRTDPVMHLEIGNFSCLFCHRVPQFLISVSSQDTSGSWSCNSCCRPQSSFQVSIALTPQGRKLSSHRERPGNPITFSSTPHHLLQASCQFLVSPLQAGKRHLNMGFSSENMGSQGQWETCL